MKNFKIPIYLLTIIVINSCSYPELDRDELIYSTSFGDDNLENIDGGQIFYFNNESNNRDFNYFQTSFKY